MILTVTNLSSSRPSGGRPHHDYTMTTHEEDLRIPEGFWEQPLTARQLQDFTECPHKFLLSQFVQREQVRRFLGGPAALHHALRTAIVQFYQKQRSAEDAQTILIGLFEDTWDGSLCADSMEEENLHSQGRQILREFADGWVGAEHQVLHTDLQLAVQMGQGRFASVADLVFAGEEDTGAVQVVRLNSSRRPPSQRELGSDLSAGLLWLLATGHFAPRQVRVGYYCLRPGRLTTYELSPVEQEQLRETLSARVRRMRREVDFEPRKGSQCRWCRVRNRCRAWKR